MVRIVDESVELTSPVSLQQKKKANKYLNFDSRIYTALITAYLFSGSIKRLLLRRFLSPTFFNAIAPTVLGLIGNGVFITALYKGANWNWLSILFMFGSRLCFGWSTYSAEDYNRRARHVIKIEREIGIVKKRVSDMVPDLQDFSFHAGVIVAIVICFIIEACLQFVGPEMAEFYSLLILSGLSTVLSLVSIPCLHIAVRRLLNMPIECEANAQCCSAPRTRPASSNDDADLTSTDVSLFYCY
ncbi:unnamed protein product [Hydatigera taeniaeformis]|uniref:Reticulon-like protein n=1 Tax=Hydatigena taeniaeformis TaxID=6205 RepID=A0A0R3WUT7_HYDTA|nr:unnamed protein product [Hydatigera taeniaeformis]